jgi:hypothetical protein
MAQFKATLRSGKEIIVNALDMVYVMSELIQQGHKYDVQKVERWSATQEREAQKAKKERKERINNECTL